MIAVAKTESDAKSRAATGCALAIVRRWADDGYP